MGPADRPTVYVRLLNEGTDVWRPVAATKLGPAYLLGGPQPDDEEWEFKPGESVECELRRLQDKPGEFLVAARRLRGSGVRHAFEFHDATLYSARVDGPDLVLAMNVCVHRSEGEPGVDEGFSWFQNLEIAISGFELIEGAAGEGLGWQVGDGALLVGGEMFKMVPFPFDRVGVVKLELAGSDATEFAVGGSAIRVALTGEPGPQERFPAGD